MSIALAPLMTKVSSSDLQRLLNDFAPREQARLTELAEMEASELKESPRYCPHQPWAKQRDFLSLDCLEVFYGGAAGGGKSDSILMAALQYVDVPGYAALILRRDYPRLSLAGAIMDRSKQWLRSTPARWNEQAKRWTFPSGATIEFGYIDSPDDRYRYASTEYQFIGWDELTEFRLSDDETNPYTFLFSRLRKTRDMQVPLRMRSASNPGNIGHAWVKRRFITDESEKALMEGKAGVFDGPEGRKFVPAAVRDNPALDPDQYSQSLNHLPPVTRARLLSGDWSVTESLVIMPTWLDRRYQMRGNIMDCGGGVVVPEPQCRRFATIDTAGTSRDRAEAASGRSVSWSVVAVWDYFPGQDLLFLRYVWRGRVEWPELKARSAATLREWNCRTVYVENAHYGPALAGELRQFAAGVARTVELVGPMLPGMSEGYRGAKLERAISSGLLNRLERGAVLFPDSGAVGCGWWSEYERELTSWSGLPDETADQIDVSSYACYVTRRQGSTWAGKGIVAAGGIRR